MSLSSIFEALAKTDSAVSKITRATRATGTLRLVGVSDVGDSLNSLFWATTLSSGGTVSADGGVLTLNAGNAPNGGALLKSSKVARFLHGTENVFLGAVQLADGPFTGNVRRWGAFDQNNGLYFVLRGQNRLGIGRRVAGVDIEEVLNGIQEPVADAKFHLYSIEYTAHVALFYQDNRLLHLLNVPGSRTTDNPDFPLGFQTLNSGGLAESARLVLRDASILRLGSDPPRPFPYVSDKAEAVLLKTGAGTLVRVIVMSKGSGNDGLALYDGIDAAGIAAAVREMWR